jgi:tetratricopeptide (TPR) repeat protein
MKVFIFVILLMLGSTKSFAQNDLGQYKSMAIHFYKASNYTSAIAIFERLLFFGDDNLSKEIYLPLARSYNKIGEYEKAGHYYNNAYNNEKVDTLRYEIIFENAVNYLLANDTNLAYSELFNIPENQVSSRIKDKWHFLIGTLDYKSRRYESAKGHFLQLSILDVEDKKEINTFFIKTKKLNRKYNPNMVELMSLFPGLGQAWCGNYEESANALLLSGALFLLYLNVSIKYHILDGLLSVYPWANRYYKGGILKAKKMAIKKRETEKNKLYNSLLKNLPTIQ